MPFLVRNFTVEGHSLLPLEDIINHVKETIDLNSDPFFVLEVLENFLSKDAGNKIEIMISFPSRYITVTKVL